MVQQIGLASGETMQQSGGRGVRSLAQPALAVLAGLLLWVRWGGVRQGIWADLDVYVRGADALIGHEPLYAVSVHGLAFTYSPFAAALFVPLEMIGSLGARWAMTAVSLACYALVVMVCARRLRMRPAIALLIGLLGLTFEPFVRDILLGQINLVLVALIVVDALVVPARYRGMLIGVAAGIKLLPGIFILFLVLKREWGAALRCVAAFLLTVVVGALLAPGDSWRFWSGGFVNLSRFGPDAVIRGDNQSLTGVVMRLTRDLSPPSLVTLLLSAGVVALGLVAAKRQIDSGNDVCALVCIAFASALASPISWTHHWVWAVMALLVLVHERRRITSVVVTAVFVLGPMWLAPRGQLQELQHNGWQAAACASYVVVGLGLLVLFARGRTSSEALRSAT
jgi:alpha-1,2-mannosyltransferase